MILARIELLATLLVFGCGSLCFICLFFWLLSECLDKFMTWCGMRMAFWQFCYERKCAGKGFWDKDTKEGKNDKSA